MLRAALVSSLVLLTAHSFARVAVRDARVVVVRASDLDEGDAFLAEAVGALQDLRVAVASERVEAARDCYIRVADASTRADREDLARSVDAQVQRIIEQMRAVRSDALAAQRTATPTDTAGDGLMRDAVSALARQDYTTARAAVDDARESFARDGVAGREGILGNLYASINVEQERAARDEARRVQERSEREQEMLRRGKSLVAEQRIADDRVRRHGAANNTVP